MQSIGMLTAYVVNLVFSASGDWRAMFWVGVVPAVVLALGATRLPESPSWLAGRGRTDEAREVLGSVAGAEGAEQVIERYRREEREQRRQHAREREPERQGWRALLARLRPAVVVGLGLAALQQFAGINTVLYLRVDDHGANGADRVELDRLQHLFRCRDGAGVLGAAARGLPIPGARRGNRARPPTGCRTSLCPPRSSRWSRRSARARSSSSSRSSARSPSGSSTATCPRRRSATFRRSTPTLQAGWAGANRVASSEST
jgi:hypothetical protein